MPSITVTDQMGANVTLQFPPRKIVSLVPSQTELLFSLGLEKEVVGITKFCVHPPEWLQTKRNVGGTKNFNFSRIRDLAPDLIIGNKEENYREGIEELRKDFPVWMSDIFNLEDAFGMMAAIGRITDRTLQADQLVRHVSNAFFEMRKRNEKSVLYLIWRKPWMAAGTNTFINDMLSRCGLKNVIGEARYPEITEARLKSLKPDYIFLSSEPFPFKEIHTEELKSICPTAEAVLVDGEMFSWYGSRLLHAPAYFQTLDI